MDAELVHRRPRAAEYVSQEREKVQNLFANGTIAMMLNGNWQIPFVEQQMKAKWGVTYLPRDVAMADDLGGTCVAVSRDCKVPERRRGLREVPCERREHARLRQHVTAPAGAYVASQ